MSELYKTLGRAGSDSILFAHKASLLLDDNMVDDAMNLCEMGVKKFPYYAEGHYVLGKCYQFIERYDDAKNEFERTLFFAPGHIKAMSALAYVYYKKKLKKLGNKYLLKTAVYEPNNRELIEYLITQKLYLQLFKSPIVEEQLSADLHGFLPTEEEKKDLQERVAKTFGMSDETKRILAKDQVDLAEESYKDQDKFEAKNIIDSIEENEMQKSGLDLSQYANVEDDFATLMGDFAAGKEDKSEDFDISSLDEKTPVTPMHGDREESLELDEPKPRESSAVEEMSELEEAVMTFTPAGTDAEPLPLSDIDDALLGDDSSSPEPAEEPAFLGVEEPSIEDIQESEPAKEVINTSSEQEEQAFSDLLMEPEGAEADEMPAFEREELDAVSTQESGPEEEFRENVQDLEPETVTETAIRGNDIPEPEDTAPEEDLIFTKKRVETDSMIPEPVAEDDGVVTIKEIMSNPSLVTPTFGEILISQRKFSEARHVFLKLWEKHPDNPRFKEKVEFLDKLIKLQT